MREGFTKQSGDAVIHSYRATSSHQRSEPGISASLSPGLLPFQYFMIGADSLESKLHTRPKLEKEKKAP
jgi:hypothetical protein